MSDATYAQRLHLSHLKRQYRFANPIQYDKDLKQIKKIILAVGYEYGVSSRLLMSRKGCKFRWAEARKMIYYLCTIIYDFKLRKISQCMGRRTTSVIIHGRNRFRRKMDGDKFLAERLDRVRIELFKRFNNVSVDGRF